MATAKDENAPRIVGGVSQNGRVYKAGDEDALAAKLSQENLDRLVDKGALAGKWKSTVSAEAVTTTSAPAPKTATKKSTRKRGT